MTPAPFTILRITDGRGASGLAPDFAAPRSTARSERRSASSTKTAAGGTAEVCGAGRDDQPLQNGNWRAFWTQRHGDNITYELIPAPTDADQGNDNDDDLSRPARLREGPLLHGGVTRRAKRSAAAHRCGVYASGPPGPSWRWGRTRVARVRKRGSSTVTCDTRFSFGCAESECRTRAAASLVMKGSAVRVRASASVDLQGFSCT